MLTTKQWLKNNKGVIIPLLFFVVSVFLITSTLIVLQKSFKQRENLLTVSEKNLAKNPNFENLKLIGTAGYVKELNTGKVLYTKNANESKPLASLTKLITAVYGQKNLEKNTIFAIQEENLETAGEYHLELGEKFSLKNLIDFSLVNSSNDAASALISAVAIKKSIDKQNVIQDVNSFAKEIGMKNSVFKNETGLDLDPETPGATGSASDVAILLEYIVKNHPELLEETNKENIRIISDSGVVHNVTNTNEELGKMTGILASKTGYTRIAGGNLAVIVDIGLNNPYIIVVLGSTEEGRFKDVIEIINRLNN